MNTLEKTTQELLEILRNRDEKDKEIIKSIIRIAYVEGKRFGYQEGLKKKH